MLWVDAAQVAGGLHRARDAFQNSLWIEQLRLAVEVGVEEDCWVNNASAARVSSVLQNGERKGQFGVCNSCRREIQSVFDVRGQLRKKKVFGLKSPRIRFFDFVDDGDGLRLLDTAFRVQGFGLPVQQVGKCLDRGFSTRRAAVDIGLSRDDRVRVGAAAGVTALAALSLG